MIEISDQLFAKTTQGKLADASQVFDGSERQSEVNDRLSLGKIFCAGILEYNEDPTQEGTYLKKDKDGDIVCLTVKSSEGVENIDPPLGKVYVVGDELYFFDKFKIVKVGYKEIVLQVDTPMLDEGQTAYQMICDTDSNPAKKIVLTSIN